MPTTWSITTWLFSQFLVHSLCLSQILVFLWIALPFSDLLAKKYHEEWKNQYEGTDCTQHPKSSREAELNRYWEAIEADIKSVHCKYVC